MSNIINSCEIKIAELIGRKHCILTGRGATALWIAYSLVSGSRNKILLPAMICLSPMFTVHYAGCTPLFADVLESDATIDPSSVKKILERNKDIGLVLAVHLYGHPAAMDELSAICRNYGALLVEDMAQALGGRDGQGRRFGKFGDISILSFGHTKILDVGDGGALLTDSDDIAAFARCAVERLNEKPEHSEWLGSVYSKLYYDIQAAGAIDPNFFRLFDQFPDLFRALYLYRPSEEIASKISGALKELPSELAHRRKIAKFYSDCLSDLAHVRLFQPTGPGVPWRFTFRLKPEMRDSILKRVRMDGFDISSWYPSVNNWTISGRTQENEFPVSEMLEGEIVNLWVSQDYSDEKAQRLIQSIKTAIAQVI